MELVAKIILIIIIVTLCALGLILIRARNPESKYLLIIMSILSISIFILAVVCFFIENSFSFLNLIIIVLITSLIGITAFCIGKYTALKKFPSGFNFMFFHLDLTGYEQEYDNYNKNYYDDCDNEYDDEYDDDYDNDYDNEYDDE